LFDELGVKRFGHTESDPFQITVTSQGPAFNLVDVGYGISQVLPVLVDSLEAPEQGTILLQQPEVHLHPRAQAELGTFLGKLVKQQRKTFVVETHSDYIIDRVRMDIRDKKTLAPDDVSILFFEKTGGAVNIHRIDIDEIGNIKNAPDAYRKFFMEEEKRYFGGT
jgi:predicted ATPase